MTLAIFLTQVTVLSLLWSIRCSHAFGATGPPDEEDLSFFIPKVPLSTAQHLAAVQARASALRDKAKESPALAVAVSEALAAAMSTVPPISLVRGLRALKEVPHEVQEFLPDAVELLAAIRGMGVAPPCLERPGAPRGPPGRFQYLIASNLMNCEAIMPYWILEVMRLSILLKGNSRMLHTYFHNISAQETTRWEGSLVHISVYESGSTDNTPAWLKVAEALWEAAGLRTFVVTGGPHKRGVVLDPFSGKYRKQHKVQFASSLRNAALEPLYNSVSGTYNYVLFLNDVFFCAPDFLRLGHLGADIACGLDFEVHIGDKKGKMPGAAHQSDSTLRRLLGFRTNAHAALHHGHHYGHVSAHEVVELLPGHANWHSAVKRMTQVHADEATRQAEADARVQEARVKPRYEFFDTWVSKDLGGNPFIKEDPLARDTRTLDLLHRGLPIPVKCCWNGGALINATLLYAGVRFRMGQIEEGECDISECSLLCEDYRRLGSRRVVIDPTVRVGYVPWGKDFHLRLPGGVGPKIPWSHVERSGALDRLAILWSDTKLCMSTQCVPLRKDSELPDMHKFKVVDMNKINYTGMFLERRFFTSPPPPIPQMCNLIMGPYGDTTDGSAFDDLAFSSWGKTAITGIYYRAVVTASESMLYALKLSYGGVATPQRGGDFGDAGQYDLQAGELVTGAAVQYDESTVFAIRFETSMNRNLTIGAFRQGISEARANPCPASSVHAGKYRLIAVAGTSDIRVRSVSLVWV